MNKLSTAGHAAFSIYAVLCAAPSMAASTFSAECPARIPPTSFAADRPPEGWTGFVPAPLYLDGAGMMASPPAGMEYLVPDKTGKDVQEYGFQKGDGERWLWCSYNGGVRLSRKLDDRSTRCVITEKRQKYRLISAAVHCK